MCSVFCFQLVSIQAFIFNELSDSRVEHIDDKGRLAGRRKIEFSSRSLGHYLRQVCSKGTGNGPHKVEKGRHALFVPVLVSVRYRLSHSHGLIKNVIATFYACLFLKLFSLKPCSQVFVSTIFLDLNGDEIGRASCRERV